MATNKEQNITITGSGTLSSDEVDRMVAEAEANREADQTRREEVETRNSLESTIFQAEKMLKEHADTILEDVKDELNAAISTAREAQTLEEVKSALETLSTALQNAGASLYQSANNEPAPEPQPEASQESDDVIDAEFEESK